MTFHDGSDELDGLNANGFTKKRRVRLMKSVIGTNQKPNQILRNESGYETQS